jgi:hypothetical protein
VAELADAFNQIRSTRALLDGRYPRDPLRKSWGYLKEEDFEKLARFCLESSLAGLVEERLFKIVSLVARIQQIIFATQVWTA